MDTTRVAVIMAGGSGERFWPLSRHRRPKQLLCLADPDRSLLQEAVGRLSGLIEPERVFIVTARHLVDPIRASDVGIPPENVIAEPSKRNTAPCLAYTAAVMLARYGLEPEAITMGVLTADQQIPDQARFLATVDSAMNAAEKQDGLVTIGIQPSRPETGYGYVEMPENAEPCSGMETGYPVYPVLQFREKPTLAEAEEMVETGRFLWNSGMFFWRISSFLREFDHASPEFSAAVRRMAAGLRADDLAAVENAFGALPSTSIDFALMEHARTVLVAPGRFAWDDVGAWDALERTLPRDSHGNACVGDPVLVDSENCIVYNEAGNETQAVALVGCSDLVVVTTGDAVLVVPKNRVQEVKAAVKKLRDLGSDHL